MEVAVITGMLNVLLRGAASGWVFSRAFVGMLSVKILFVIAMAGLQVWMGLAWKREGGSEDLAVRRRARAAITIQLLLGAAAVLLGLGVRSV